MPGLRALAALLLLGLQLLPSSAQTCGSSDVISAGAEGKGSRDDSDAFLRVERDASAGVIYVPPGVYLLSQTFQLNKPIVAAEGAVLKVRGAARGQPVSTWTALLHGTGRWHACKGEQSRYYKGARPHLRAGGGDAYTV